MSLVNFITELSSIKICWLRVLRIFGNTVSLCLANQVHNVLLVFECLTSECTFLVEFFLLISLLKIFCIFKHKQNEIQLLIF